MESPKKSNRSSTQSNHKKPPLRLLSLDDGGVRGYSMIIILEELMSKVFVEIHGRAPKQEEIPKPCDHFDLIGGTGIGGLIAILLGRLRLDLDTCRAVFAKITQQVFDVDKGLPLVGISYRKTYFKASKLETAIREAVREASRQEDEETVNLFIDPKSSVAQVRKKGTAEAPASGEGSAKTGWRPSSSFSSSPLSRLQWGGENALLYDSRPRRCRTFVTAVYKGSDKTSPPALLRSYKPARASIPSFGSAVGDCTIWEAGRATCATYPSFKYIQIGNDKFLDEGSGRYSPVAQVLEEALVHEWPGREVGVLVSIGSGNGPDGGSKKESSGRIMSPSPFGRFVEAKEIPNAKVADCEDTHRDLLQGLHRTGVKGGGYFRLNAEVGISPYRANEGSIRLEEISNCTEKYLATPDVRNMNSTAASKLAEIYRNGKEGFSHTAPNGESPNLPLRAESEEDEEVAKYFEEIYKIKMKVQG